MKKTRREKGRLRLTALIAVLLMVLCGSGCSQSGDSFQGTWDLDGTTMYRFDGFGKGSMVLPSSSYEFCYTADEEAKTLFIDFAEEKARDYTYTYELSHDRLILSGGNGSEAFAYEFEKVEN